MVRAEAGSGAAPGPSGYVLPVALGLSVLGGLGSAVLGPVAVPLAFALPVMVVAMVRYPGILLAAYLLTPFYKFALAGILPVDVTVLLALLNGAQLFWLVTGKVQFAGSKWGLALWVVFGLLVLGGVTWAGDQGIALDRAIAWWILVVLPLIAVVRVVSDSQFVDQFLAATFALGLLVIFVGFSLLFGGERLAVLGENTIQTGQITLIAAIIGVAWIASVAPVWLRWLGIAVIPIALIESVASGSRGPILAFLIVLAVAVARRMVGGRGVSRHDLRLALAGTVAIAAIAVVLDRLPSLSLLRFQLLAEELGTGNSGDSSFTVRVELFQAAADLFATRPLLGHGTGSFAAFAQGQVGFTTFTYPHDILLQLGAELGFVAVSIFVGLVVIAFTRRGEEAPRWAAIRGLALFMFVNASISGDIYSDRLLLGLLLLLIAAPMLPRLRETPEPIGGVPNLRAGEIRGD